MSTPGFFLFGADEASRPEGINRMYSVADLHPDLPAHRRGGTVFISPVELAAWVEQQVNR